MIYCWFCNHEINDNAIIAVNRKTLICDTCNIYYYCSHNKEKKIPPNTIIAIRIPLKSKIIASISLWYKEKYGKRTCKVFTLDEYDNKTLLFQIDSYQALSYPIDRLKKKLINLIPFI
jgi:hypothetical protein